jgi:hypothetical protein
MRALMTGCAEHQKAPDINGLRRRFALQLEDQ